MPFQPGTPDELNTRNDEVDGQGITIDSTVSNRNRILFWTGSEGSAPPYAPLAVPVPPANIEVSQVAGGYADMSFNGPSNYDGSSQAQIRLGANIGTMHANNATTIDLLAQNIRIGLGNIPVVTGQVPNVRVASSNLLVLKGDSATVVTGRLEDHDFNNIGYLGTRFGAHKRWDAIASGSLNPWWNGNTRHGLAFPLWQAQIFWDGGPLVHMRAFYDTGASGFSTTALAFTPQDINFQVASGFEQAKLTLPFSPSTLGWPHSSNMIIGNGSQYRSRLGVRQIRNAGIANGAECFVFDYDDTGNIVTMSGTQPFAFPRFWASLSVTFPII